MIIMNEKFWLFLFLCSYFGVVLNDEIVKNKKIKSAETELAEEIDNRLLVFATLDGTLAAIDKYTGKIKWKVKDRPIVQVPLNTSKALIPIFLPDPRDGSLYLMGNSREPLKKLPFKIPQLVHSSPCRSSDGILYTGRKKDIWYKLDPRTGNREQIVGWGDHSPTCPVEVDNFIYIGRSKYNILMVDTNARNKKWNVTFYDYTAADMRVDDLNSYDLVHFASTSSGKFLTLDRRRGNLLWDGDLGSPIIAMYLLTVDGLIKIPFTSLANHTIHYLATEISVHDGLVDNPNHMKLYPTLYIGEHRHGLYAIPSLVDQNVVTITASDVGPLLLGGPHAPESPQMYSEYPLPGHNYRLPREALKDSNFQSLSSLSEHILIYTGHYNVPNYTEANFIGPNRPHVDVKLITDESKMLFDKSRRELNNKIVLPDKTQNVGTQTEESSNRLKKISDGKNVKKENDAKNQRKVIDAKADVSKDPRKRNYGKNEFPDPSAEKLVLGYYAGAKQWINQQDNKGLKLSLIIMTGIVFAMFWYLLMQVREVQNMSQNGSKGSNNNFSGKNGKITAYSEELPGGLVKVGKITFHPEQLLGKGCEGTFVYRGDFDNRRVAVKRLLPECFTFADREVALLRESDAHPNVIRYYCMEQDRMFRYIALELCQATLSEYMQGLCDRTAIKPLEILKQATSGLAHLHALDIVHRDIKPHNVLISVPNSKGEVKAMISDFGLCKKLQLGRDSFSRRSGVTGTDGWIAPEMMDGNERTTAAVDLFSLGCLYYYVLSNGAHPFGDVLRRQANILMGEYDLKQLQGPDWSNELQKPLIEALLSSVPKDRPSCNAVLAHPMFWNSQKILSFFQDVSDRVEKADLDDSVLLTLEDNGKPVVKHDWRVHIHEEVAKDLRKYRTYRGDSVRDLLRALRNKKHHFRELTKEAQESLGEIPEAFTNYWISRFPLLLVHSYMTMQYVSDENTFHSYYDKSYRYSLSKFRHQVHNYIKLNPVSLPCEANLEHFEKKKTDDFYEKYKSYSTRNSPKRSPIIPIVATNSGGLYRNNQRKVIDVSVSDITVSFRDVIKDNNGNGSLYKPPPRRETYPLKKPNKKKKKVDEPLVWAIRDDK